MSPELLSLHVSQLNRAVGRSKTNKYADPRKQDYHASLIELFSKVSTTEFSKANDTERKELKSILDFCFLSIEFLDNSTLVNIPYEIVYCLEKALQDWDNSNDYIIVTSLQNNLLSYSFDPTLALDVTIYDLIRAKYSIEFRHKLIQINLPKYLAHDYLANVVLYHELGHFIDQRFRICNRIAIILGLNPAQENHYEEFFADIFASQYIGKASNFYLGYIAHGDGDCHTHPATDKRITMVEEYLCGHDNSILETFKIAVPAIVNKELFINDKKIDDGDFRCFIPSEPGSSLELHSIFEVGWGLWLNEIAEYDNRGITRDQKYRIINNLLEKTISNFMITEKWKANVPN
ncbi:hypothetical protein [Mangrovibacterium diazotrophicum]|uniref:Uncharacterized protein n=1 Tax=Mangrovibacterium diazotrophicum TaxID=1261403 RepID=A0A419WAN7_9BACT|nr:hypothetical protein [Mangrovibacterium diazotrophicum]RKD92528.1 hypothetical protein BC643_2902 [Mangrovibacterium diazotrophicum]